MPEQITQIRRVSNEWPLNDSAVSNALSPWFEHRLNKLPREQRRFAEAYIPAWPDISPEARRAKAEEVDRQRAIKLGTKFRLSESAKKRAEKCPKQVAEAIIAWHDETLDAAAWWGLGAVTPCEAAMLLCRFNPHDDASDPLNTTTDKAGPDDYKLLLRFFEDIQKRNPQHRTLLQWLDIARDKKLKYHWWIDEYRNALATITPPLPAESQKQTDPSESPEKAAPEITPADDTERADAPTPTTAFRLRVAWQRVLFDSWLSICKTHGRTPTPLEAVRWMKRNDTTGTILDKGTNREMLWQPQRGPAKKVTLGAVQNVISGWRVKGVIPA